MSTKKEIGIITIFPQMFSSLDHGITGTSLAKNAKITTFNPRDHADNKHGHIDDTPYGGGPGMLIQAEPLLKCMDQAKKQIANPTCILLSPRGVTLNQKLVKKIASIDNLILVCGRYKGIDQRFIDQAIDLEISIGDFILSGGEIAAMALVDACTRLMPNSLNSPESAENDSFNDGLLEFNQYTRPKTIANMSVPDILLSGNHAAISKWRKKQSLGLTWQKRPDLLDKLKLSKQDIALLDEFKSQLNKGDKNARDNETIE